MLSVESLKLSPVQVRHLVAASRTNAVFLDKETLHESHLSTLDVVGVLLDANAGLQHELTTQRDYSTGLAIKIDELEREALEQVLDAGSYENELAALRAERDALKAKFDQYASCVPQLWDEYVKVAKECSDLKAEVACQPVILGHEAQVKYTALMAERDDAEARCAGLADTVRELSAQLDTKQARAQSSDKSTLAFLQEKLRIAVGFNERLDAQACELHRAVADKRSRLEEVAKRRDRYRRRATRAEMDRSALRTEREALIAANERLDTIIDALIKAKQ